MIDDEIRNPGPDFASHCCDGCHGRDMTGRFSQEPWPPVPGDNACLHKQCCSADIVKRSLALDEEI